MGTPLPPIHRDCRRLLVLSEEAVRRFARYHKYTVGTELRMAAMQLMKGVNRAVHDRGNLLDHVRRLVWLIDDYKLCLQLAMDVGAFAANPQQGATAARFASFEAAATLAAGIGKQCGGWLQSLLGSQRAQSGGEAPSPTGPAPGGAALHAAGSKPGLGAQAHPASLSTHAASQIRSSSPGSSPGPEAKP